MTTTLNKSFSQMVDEQLIDITDFSKYHLHKLNENDMRYAYEVKEEVNKMYQTFHETILKKHADKDSKIPTKKGALLWVLYEDSFEVMNMVKHKSLLREVDDSIPKWWIEEITGKSPVQLFSTYGKNTISSAYGIIIDYYRDWVINQKYTRIYSKSKNFDDWIELASQNMSLMNCEEQPFDMKKIEEKCKTIIAVPRTAPSTR